MCELLLRMLGTVADLVPILLGVASAGDEAQRVSVL